jgi:hypothetical protein
MNGYEAGAIISKQRNRLSPNQLLFLNSYFKSNTNSETLMKKLLEKENSKTAKYISIISIPNFVYLKLYFSFNMILW